MKPVQATRGILTHDNSLSSHLHGRIYESVCAIGTRIRQNFHRCHHGFQLNVDRWTNINIVRSALGAPERQGNGLGQALSAEIMTCAAQEGSAL